MPAPLLFTKLHIPSPRPELITRPRLIELLDVGLSRKLTLISAPAGFGKTTLLSTWVHQNAAPAAWISLDESENDPTLFLAYILTALQSVVSSVGVEILENLQSPQPDISETTLIAIINEISTAFPDDFVLILDDYHLITTPASHAITDFLLGHMPPGMHLIIATRADPDLQLPRLRGRGELIEIRQNDLRFTHPEVTAFINQMRGLKLSSDDIGALTTRTEGWVAGLQMAVLSMADKPDVSQFVKEFSGSDRYILDYLMDEVFQAQPSEIQDFLLKTSLVNRLTASLCSSLTGIDNSQLILEDLERKNLFIIPQDNKRNWYRYHRLFADLLQKRLSDLHSDQISELHQRASSWYKAHGFAAEAIQHSLSAGDYDSAGDLIDNITEETLMRSEIETFLRWVEELPESVIEARPNLGIGLAWSLLISGNSLEKSEEILNKLTCNTNDLLGKKKIVESSIAVFRGQLSEARELAQNAITLLAENEVRFREMANWTISYTNILDSNPADGIRTLKKVVEKNQSTGNMMGSFAALWQISRLYIQQGKLSEAKHTLEQILGQAKDQHGNLLPISGEAMMSMGELYRESNQLMEAEQFLKKGIELSKKGRGVTAYLGFISLARVSMAQGDAHSAADFFEEAKMRASFGFDYLMATVMEAKINTMRGEIKNTESWLEERGWIADEIRDEESDDLIDKHMNKYERLLLVRVLLAQNQHKNALKHLDFLKEKMLQQGRIDMLLEINLLSAIAHHSLGDLDESLSALEKAISYAEPGYHFRVFVDEGKPLQVLLERALSQGIYPHYVSKLLEGFSGSSHLQTHDLVEPLSGRELEVLRLLPSKLTASEIADQLYVAESTIRTHIKHIYSKLNVNRRFEAVERARELGLM